MLDFIDTLLGLFDNREQDAQADRDRHAGQGLVEYALILSFIAIAVIIALAFFGGRLNTIYSRLGNSIP